MSHHCHDEKCSCHDHSHEHHEEHCSCHNHAHEHHEEHCNCHDHAHKHHEEHCSCHDHAHKHHEDGCCEHCEAKLHGEVTVKKSTVWRIGVAAVLFVISFLLPLEGAPSLLFCLLPYLVIGYDVLYVSLCNILRGKLFDEQFLMSIASIGAFAIGEYHEAVAVMLFYQIGELCQDIAVGKSRRSIAALMDIRPDFAVVVREGREYTVSPEEVEVGECVIVRAGERIPLDGTVISGESQVDNTALTGESLPVSVKVGDSVHGGGVNIGGVLSVRVQSRYHESTVAKILELVEHAAEKKSRTESFITRFSRYYTPIVVFGALLLAVLPPLLFSQPLAEWVRRALVFLVVSCPCALVISVPLSFFGGIGGASRCGILIKGAGYLEQLSRVDTVVLDKTGTLTVGKFSVAQIQAQDIDAQELLRIAAAIERFSNHPIAQSIVAAYHGELPDAHCVKELAGKGMQGEVEGTLYLVGNAALMAEKGIALPELSQVQGVVYVARGTDYLGYLALQDVIKTNAKKALQQLAQQGVKQTVMLTGDSAAVAAQVGKELGIHQLHAELLPQQKAERVEKLLAEGKRVAFVGDGINDAPVLARADVGIAMGAIGSDAAIESADVVLMDDDLSKLPRAISIAKKTMRIVRQNILFALAAKGVILLLGAMGIAGMWVAVFGDVGVMLLAIFNSMRAMLVKKG